MHFVSVVSVRVDTICGGRFRCFLVAICIWGRSYNVSTNKPNIFVKKSC